MANILYCKSGGSDNNSGCTFGNSPTAYGSEGVMAGGGLRRIDISAEADAQTYVADVQALVDAGDLVTVRCNGANNGINSSDIFVVTGTDDSVGSEYIQLDVAGNDPNALTDGDWVVGGSFESPNRLCDIAYAGYELRCCYAGSTYTLASHIEWANAGSDSACITVYSADPATGERSSTRTTLDADGTSFVLRDQLGSHHVYWKDVVFQNAVITGVTLVAGSDEWVFDSCRFTDFDDVSNVGLATVNTGKSITCIDCEFDNCYYGVYGPVILLNCHLHDCVYGAYLLSSYAPVLVAGCLIDTMSGYGLRIYLADDRLNNNANLYHNTIDDCVTGIRIDKRTAISITAHNNIISNNTTGISGDESDTKVILAANHFYNNTNDYSNVHSDYEDSNSTSGNPYLDDDDRPKVNSNVITSDDDYSGAYAPHRPIYRRRSITYV